MIEKVTYSRVFLIISLLLICIQGKAIQQCDSASLALMEGTWREFREIHPFGFQTVALKHRGDTCVFVMSEPSGWVKNEDLEKLFTEYGGHLIIGRQPFGYDGALYDAIGCAVLDSVKFKGFESRLFRCLYGTPYKPYYTDLDNPSPHVYFSDIKISNENLLVYLKNKLLGTTFNVEGQDKTFDEIIQSDSIPYIFPIKEQTPRSSTPNLYYSKERGFVVWKVNHLDLNRHIFPFRIHARRFALDTDLIVCALRKGMFSYIVGREREIPVTILPPLRSETIALLASLTMREYVSFYPDSAIVVKDSLNVDSVWATPITMSDRLQNTELGNLMVLSDMMLKSWSENAKVKDVFIDYPQPRSFFTKDGVAKELGYEPKYIWRYYPIDFSSRTGCLPPHYYAMNDSLSPKAKELSDKAYEYFANLNNTDLIRVNQYAMISRALITPQPLLFQPDSWTQTPSTTVSNCPWGYGGCMLQVPVIVNTARKALERLTYRGFNVPNPLWKVVSRGGSLPLVISNALRNEEIAYGSWVTAQINYRKKLITERQYNIEKKKYDIIKCRLTEELNKFREAHRGTLIMPATSKIGRGFVPEVHNVSPSTVTQEKTVTIKTLQDTESSSKWK